MMNEIMSENQKMMNKEEQWQPKGLGEQKPSQNLSPGDTLWWAELAIRGKIKHLQLLT